MVYIRCMLRAVLESTQARHAYARLTLRYLEDVLTTREYLTAAAFVSGSSPKFPERVRILACLHHKPFTSFDTIIFPMPTSRRYS